MNQYYFLKSSLPANKSLTKTSSAVSEISLDKQTDREIDRHKFNNACLGFSYVQITI